MSSLEIQSYEFDRMKSAQSLFIEALSQTDLVAAMGAVPGCKVVGHFGREHPITCFQVVFGLRSLPAMRQIIETVLTEGVVKEPHEMIQGDLVFYTHEAIVHT